MVSRVLHPFYIFLINYGTSVEVHRLIRKINQDPVSRILDLGPKERNQETNGELRTKKSGELNNMYGKLHTKETKDLIRQKALGKKYSALLKVKRGACAPSVRVPDLGPLRFKKERN